MPKTKLAISRFVICVENKGYKASLEKRKVYISVPDAKALKHGHIRVVDESGEDYLYPKAFFAPVQLTPPARRALAAT